MSANAYLLVRDVEAADEFLLLGCDGIWDTKTTQEIVDFVRQRLPEVWEADCLEPQVLAGFPRLQAPRLAMPGAYSEELGGTTATCCFLSAAGLASTNSASNSLVCCFESWLQRLTTLSGVLGRGECLSLANSCSFFRKLWLLGIA